jgi:hypothetical protein
MKCVQKWHKVGQILTALIYLLSIPFVILFFLHSTNPNFDMAHNAMNGLFYIACGVLFFRFIIAAVTKSKICKWEHFVHKKLSGKEIIHLI